MSKKGSGKSATWTSGGDGPPPVGDDAAAEREWALSVDALRKAAEQGPGEGGLDEAPMPAGLEHEEPQRGPVARPTAYISSVDHAAGLIGITAAISPPLALGDIVQAVPGCAANLPSTHAGTVDAIIDGQAAVVWRRLPPGVGFLPPSYVPLDGGGLVTVVQRARQEA